MTEKRFNRVGGYVYDGDKCISHFEDVAHRDDIVKLLNELSEENGQLRHDATILILSNQDYRKENEQLKQRNKRLEEKIQRERRVSAKQHLKWSKEAETKIKELSEENERLKKELLFFYDVANCECSTNWKGDMEKGCKRFFNCTYEEAKEKYGDYDGMWWEIND